jgi:outer membrane protein
MRSTLLVVLHCANCALAQNAPVSSERPWQSPAERNIEADLKSLCEIARSSAHVGYDVSI